MIRHPDDMPDAGYPDGEAQDTRIPPHDLTAEQCVLGAMLLDHDACRKAARIVTPDDFYRAGHQQIATAMASVLDRGETLDPVTLRAQLESNETLDAAGGWEYIGWLMDAVPTTANVEYHAKIVARTASQRRMGAELQRLAAAAWAPGADVESVAVEAVSAMLPTASGGKSGRSRPYVPLEHLVWDAMQTIEDRHRGVHVDLVSLGLPELDREPVEGVEVGDLVTLLLVSGHGKTALALSMMRWASEAGTACGFVSAEMPGRQLVNRMLSGYSGIPFGRLRKGRLYDSEWPRLANAAAAVAALPCHVDDTPLPALRDIRAKTLALKAAHPAIRLVFVDYIQLLSGGGKQRTLEIEDATYGLKSLAKEAGIVVVQLAQPDGKDIDRRGADNKMPQLADIAWSQAIRNASDLVVCGYRPGRYDPMREDDCLLMEVPKSRASGHHEFRLRWHGPTMLAWSPTQPAPWAQMERAA